MEGGNNNTKIAVAVVATVLTVGGLAGLYNTVNSDENKAVQGESTPIPTPTTPIEPTPEPTPPPLAPVPAPEPKPPPAPVENCVAGYDPCIEPGSDVDCASGSGNGPRYVDGPVYVTGSDPYDLDRDGDGVGCE